MRRFFLFTLFCVTGFIFAEYKLEISSHGKTSMPIGLILVKAEKKLESVALAVTTCLEKTGQFSIITTSLPIFNMDAVKTFKQKGIGMIVVLEKTNDDLTWRLFDTVKAEQLAGKVIPCLEEPWVCAGAIADDIWPILVNEPGIFSSVIAACRLKDTKVGSRSIRSVEVFSPIFGSSGPRKTLVANRSDNFAPRWHPKKLTLFYSQHTPTNVRLMSVDHMGLSRIITDFPGFNLTPAFSSDGKIVMSLSSGANNQLFRYYFDESASKSVFEKLSSENGSFASPTFLDDETLLVEFINLAGVSKLGAFSLIEKKLREIPIGNAYAPSAFSKKLCAYCKKKDGYLQVFVYDQVSGLEKQVTFSKENKDEPSWSPCGQYIVYSAEKDGRSRIAVSEVVSCHQWYLTPAQENWSFPSWAPVSHLSFLTHKK